MRADVEALLVGYLGPLLVCRVSADVPSPRPERLVTVERTGGRSSGFADRATVAVQSWAPTRSEASRLALEVDALMPGFVAAPGVRRVDKDTLYNNPDPESGSPRYQAVYEIASFDA